MSPIKVPRVAGRPHFCVALPMRLRVPLVFFLLVFFPLPLWSGVCWSEDGPLPQFGPIESVFKVDKHGGATLVIPISVPPLPGAPEPKLDLMYNSLGSNGFLGQGFNLAGLPSIGRVGQNPRIDDSRTAVDYSATDRFVMDGHRLIAQDPNLYGSDGMVYHTEIETWSRVTSHGSQGGGPISFTVVDRNGNVMEFGATASSRITASVPANPVRVWALSSLTDKFGNSMVVDYWQESGAYYPLSINYRKGPLAERTVNFTYEVRPDPSLHWVGGSMVSETQRLTGIQSLFANYHFHYEQGSFVSRSRLSQIDVTGELTALNSTTIEWQERDKGWESPIINVPPGPLFKLRDEGGIKISDRVGLLQDINGDGLADYVNCDAEVFLGGFVVEEISYFRNPAYDLPGPLFTQPSPAVRQIGLLIDMNADGLPDFVRGTLQEVVPGQGNCPGFDNDGDTDDWECHNEVYLNTGTAFAPSTFDLPGPLYWLQNDVPSIGILQDMDGDGYPDYSMAGFYDFGGIGGHIDARIHKGTGTGFVDTQIDLPEYLFLASHQVSLQTGYLQDVTGDGLPEVWGKKTAPIETFMHRNRGDMVFVNDPFLFFPQDPFYQVSDNPVSFELAGIIRDINRDGIADFSLARDIVTQFELDVFYGTGTGFNSGASAWVDSGWDLPSPVFLVRDPGGVPPTITIVGEMYPFTTDRTSLFTNQPPEFLNGQLYGATETGFVDLDYALPGELLRSFTRPDGFLGWYQVSDLIDVNGDGLLDFVHAFEPDDGPSQRFVELAKTAPEPGGPGNVISSIDNGFGRVTTIDYDVITGPDTDLYSRDQYRIEPYGQSAAWPMWVVRQSSIQTNETLLGRFKDEYKATYQYRDAMSDSLGRGFLGFETVIVNEVFEGSKLETTYEQEWPFVGMVKSQRTLDSSNGDALTSVDNVYGLQVPGGGFTGSMLPVLLSKERNWGDDNITSLTSYEYDDFGNPTRVEKSGNDATDHLITIATYDNFAPPTGFWQIGLPTRVEERGTLTSDYRVQEFGYLDIYTAEKVQWIHKRFTRIGFFDQLEKFLSERYDYDELGNVISVTQVGEDDVDIGNYTTSYDNQGVYPEIMTNPMGHQESMVFDSATGTLLQRVDANGVEFSRTLDGLGRVLSESGPDPQGQTSVLRTWERMISVTPTVERSVAIHQRVDWDDTELRRIEIEFLDGLGRTSSRRSDAPTPVFESFTYDTPTRRRSLTGPYTQTVAPTEATTAFDATSRPILIEQFDGPKTAITYTYASISGSVMNCIERTDGFGTPESRTVRTYVDVQGRVWRREFPMDDADTRAAAIDYTYDALGRLLTVSGDTETTTYQYDGLDRVSTVDRGPYGSRIVGYDAAGNVSLFQEGASRVVNYFYDSLGRITRERQGTLKSPQETITIDYRYDEPSASYGIGRLTSVQGVALNSGDSFAYQYFYHPDGRLAMKSATIQGEGPRLFGSEYDATGALIRRTYPDGSLVESVYDVLGNLMQISVDGTVHGTYGSYNPAGQPGVLRLDQSGVETRFSYDQRSRPTRIFALNPDGVTPFIDDNYQWNAVDYVSAIGSPLSVGNRSYDYTKQGYLKQATGPYGSYSYTYDLKGNMLTKSNPDRTDATYTHFQGLMTNVQYEDGRTEQLTYDSKGNLESRDLGPLRYLYDVDAVGNVVQVSRETSRGTALAEKNVFDHTGQRIYKMNQKSATYYFDDNYESSPLATGDWRTTKYIPGVHGKIMAITTESNTLGLNSRPPSNFDSLIDRVASRDSETLELAGLGFLIGPKTPRNSATNSWRPAWWEYTLLTLCLVIVLRLFWRTASGAQVRLRLREMIRPKTRFCALEPSHPTWVQSKWISSTLIACLALWATHVELMFGDRAVAQIRWTTPSYPEAGTLYFHHDHLQNVTHITDEQGEVVSEFQYTPFGSLDKETSVRGKRAFNPRFVDQEHDPSTGHEYLNARFYAPEHGRFLTPDVHVQGGPDWNASAFNRYVYGMNNPVTLSDPSGEIISCLIAIAIGAVVGAYFGGVAANHGSYDPTHWKWNKSTFEAMALGAVIGGVGGAVGGGFIGAGAAGIISAGEAIGGTLVAGALYGAIGSVSNAYFAGDSLKQMGMAALTGAAFGAVGAAAGGALAAGLGQALGDTLGDALGAVESSARVFASTGAKLASSKFGPKPAHPVNKPQFSAVSTQHPGDASGSQISQYGHTAQTGAWRGTGLSGSVMGNVESGVATSSGGVPPMSKWTRNFGGRTTDWSGWSHSPLYDANRGFEQTWARVITKKANAPHSHPGPIAPAPQYDELIRARKSF